MKTITRRQFGVSAAALAATAAAECVHTRGLRSLRPKTVRASFRRAFAGVAPRLRAPAAERLALGCAELRRGSLGRRAWQLVLEPARLSVGLAE